MLKHAYLIMIHEYTFVLERLLQLLDEEGCGIYIHIDKNAKGVSRERLRGLVRKSAISIYSRYKVYWGTNSVALAELYLLKKAFLAGEGYDYYHILSGADLPIKPQKQRQEFFEENNGKEFIHFGTAQYQRDIACRYEAYHFFSRQLGRKRDKKLWVDAETYALAIQRRLHIDRKRKADFSFYGGANWCSITGGFAEYVLKNARRYKKAFVFTQISDELLMQTIVMDSPYKDNLYKKGFDDDCEACARYIDWKRGNPYVFRIGDFDLLASSNCIFARKFDEKTDREIIDMIYHSLGEKTENESFQHGMRGAEL